MKNELKAIVLKFLNKWLFPDFTNKLTWAIATSGIAIIVTPIELRVALWNWLISTLNMAGVVPIEVPSLEERNDGWGYFLIIAALVHNIIYKVIEYKMDALNREVKRDKRQMDIQLYERFITLLPTLGFAVQMLRDQDFGQLIRASAMEAIDEFIYYWEGAEFKFNAQEIELQKTELLVAMREFRGKVSVFTSPHNSEFLTVYPKSVDPDFNVPSYLKENIKIMNDMATQIFNAHQCFITACKSKI